MRIQGSPVGLLKEFKQAVKEELQGLVVDWHKDTAPGHFKKSAKEKYNYDARSTKYQRYKDKKHLPPLVYSGQSRRQILQSIRVSGTFKKATGVAKAPRYFWMTTPGHPNKPEELYALTQREAEAMAVKLNKKVTARLNAVKDKKVVNA
jgi:hypothetical protein